MEQGIIQLLAENPLFVASSIASIVGIGIYYMYSGFIEDNYMKIKWFRRMFLPHLTALVHIVDKKDDDSLLDNLKKIESDTTKHQHVFSVYLAETNNKEDVLRAMGHTLIENHFRPEVILASLGTNPDGDVEDGNFVLTAPERRRFDIPVLGRIYDIFLMLTAKYQLHVRVYYDDGTHSFHFYAHHELNPYNPFYAKRHLKGDEFNVNKGVKMFRKYKDEMEKYGVEVVVLE